MSISHGSHDPFPGTYDWRSKGSERSPERMRKDRSGGVKRNGSTASCTACGALQTDGQQQCHRKGTDSLVVKAQG